MAIQIGRLRDVGFAKRGAAPTGPVAGGSFISPTLWYRFLPPFDWYPKIALVESPAISADRQLPVKAVKGAGSLKGLKASAELEPTDVFAAQLMAAFGQDTVTGDGTTAPHAHNFDALQSAQLPTYDWWSNEGDKQLGFAGMMCSKYSLMAKVKEVVKVETEWNGIAYVDGLALSPSLSYSALKPLTFANIDAKLAGGSAVTNMDECQIDVDNKVEEDYGLRSDSNYPSRLTTEHQLVTGKFSQILEDMTEYNKFLAVASPSLPTSSSLEIDLTSGETSTEGAFGTFNWKFLYLLPSILYRTAEVKLAETVIKVGFTYVALPASSTVGSGGNAHAFTSKAISVQWINGSATPY